MPSLVIDFDKIEDGRLLEQLAARLGLKYFIVSEEERRLLARKALTNLSADPAECVDAPEQLITQVMENIRSERYEKKKNSGRN